MRNLLLILSVVIPGFVISCEKDVTKLYTTDLVGEWQIEDIEWYQIVDGESVEVEPEGMTTIQLNPKHKLIITQDKIAYVINSIRLYHAQYALINGVIYANNLSDYYILEYSKSGMTLKLQDHPTSSEYYILRYRRLSSKVY